LDELAPLVIILYGSFTQRGYIPQIIHF